MLSFINVMPFDLKKQSTNYQELKDDCKPTIEGEIDSITVIPQPLQLKNPNFDIMQLPNSLAGEKKVKHFSWRRFRQVTNRFSARLCNLRFSREPKVKQKSCEVVTTHLKVMLKKQPAQPVHLNQEGDIITKKHSKKLRSKKTATKILTHLNNPPDANLIISTLKKEPHRSYDLKKINTPHSPLRGVCLRQSQAESDSQTVSEDAIIDVTKALATRIVPSCEVINLITGLSFGKVVGILGESSGVFDALAMGSKHLIDQTDAHQKLIGMVPKDRVSVWSYWWGFEIALPTPSVERLKRARSIETTAFQILAALTTTSGAIEIFPLIKYLSTYLDIEWNAISAENKGKGVVIAATWAFPMALVPRSWDFDAPMVTELNKENLLNP